MSKTGSSPSGFAAAAKIAAAATIGVATWSCFVEPQLFTIRRHTLNVLPAGSRPVRILQLSDLHLAPFHHRKIAWVRSLARLNPDLVVLTGDLMGHKYARGPLHYALEPFEAANIPGVFVHGSNDYFSPILKNPMNYLRAPSSTHSRKPDLNNKALTQDLESLGFINLNNTATRLKLHGTSIELFGLNDPHIKYSRPDEMNAALLKLRNGESVDTTSPIAKPPTSQTRIGVVHAPYQSALNALLTAGAQLVLAGHTHGGQVRVPGVGALTANCDLPNTQARGLSAWYNAHEAAYLNVSAGLGASIYSPMRFACRPEASLLTLEAANA